MSLKRELNYQSGKNPKNPKEEYELPLKVAATYLHPNETVIVSMDFHPVHQTLLIVGCLNGAVYVWDVAVNDRWLYEFEIWKLSDRSPMFKDSISKVMEDLCASRVTWSPDGKFFGISFSKPLIHIYLLKNSGGADQYVEFEAHSGSRICDLAFCYRNEQVDIVTCGDDKLVTVWELKGEHEAPMELFHFSEHEQAVKFLCVRKWEDSQVVFTTDIDGRTIVVNFDNGKSIFVFDAAYRYTQFRSSADGSRLFSCGLDEGDPVLLEWDVDTLAIKRTYSDVGEQMYGMVQYDTTQNRFLVAGVGKTIKFWDMDRTSVLETIQNDKTESLLRLPRVKFNLNGNILAVQISNCRLRIFANDKGIEYMKQVKVNREPSKKIKIR